MVPIKYANEYLFRKEWFWKKERSVAKNQEWSIYGDVYQPHHKNQQPGGYLHRISGRWAISSKNIKSHTCIAQLRSDYCKRLKSYISRINQDLMIFPDCKQVHNATTLTVGQQRCQRWGNISTSILKMINEGEEQQKAFSSVI